MSLVPAFALETYEEPDGSYRLDLGIPTDPDIKRHASLALLHGLAIMFLDDSGLIDRVIDALLEEGPINEVDACNRITTLLMKEQNALPN